MPLYNYSNHTEWRGNDKKPEEIGIGFLRIADIINRAYVRPVGCIRTRWMVADLDEEIGSAPLSKYIDNFTNYIENNICTDEDEEPDPMGGYWIYAGLRLMPKPTEKLGIFKLFLCDGSPVVNHFDLEVGADEMPPDPSRVSFPFFKETLLGGVSIWPAEWASARCNLWGARPAEASGDPSFPYSTYQMPWMAYLSAERAAKVKAPAGIVTERTPDGGLLMIAAETRLDPQNPEHMKRSRALAEILIEHVGKM